MTDIGWTELLVIEANDEGHVRVRANAALFGTAAAAKREAVANHLEGTVASLRSDDERDRALFAAPPSGQA